RASVLWWASVPAEPTGRAAGTSPPLPIPPAVQMGPPRAVHNQSRAAATTEAPPARTGPEGARPADCGPPPPGQKQARRAMKVILAQPRGFFAGVVRAIEIVEQALEKYGPPAYGRAEIVYKKFVVYSLKGQGRVFGEAASAVTE